VTMRDDLDDYFGDVTYRVWISGGNPDEVDLDRVGESHWDGDDADACANDEDQAAFLKGAAKEFNSWDTRYQAEMQMHAANRHLTPAERELLSVLFYKPPEGE